LDFKYQKIQKDREKELIIKETIAKEEIVKELKRRKIYENWDKKIEIIEKTRE